MKDTQKAWKFFSNLHTNSISLDWTAKALVHTVTYLGQEATDLTVSDIIVTCKLLTQTISQT